MELPLADDDVSRNANSPKETETAACRAVRQTFYLL